MKTTSSDKTALRAKNACQALSLLPTAKKNAALLAMAASIRASRKQILTANAKDVAAARRSGLAPALVARLMLDEAKLLKVAYGVAAIASLPDPVGRTLSENKRPNGLRICKVSVPIGTILIIYESRPTVTADCMALCLKSGNAVLLKGGREAAYSNKALFSVMEGAAVKAGVPGGAFGFVAAANRAEVKKLLRMNDTIDLVIPRGGEGLIREVTRVSTIPVIKHYKGVCHVFIDASADLAKSRDIIVNAKTQNPGVCNAAETLLVHEQVASKFLPVLCDALKAKGVELRADAKTRAIVPGLKTAAEKDWYAEYLDLVLSVRVVKDLSQAVEHIQKYGSRHSDAIVTEDKEAASRFAGAVDSACVFINCSTRFNDGGEFGMGAEMGISTDKLHARGPMGLEELTTYKYVVTGNGQVRT